MACEPCAINFYKDNAATVQGEYATCTECPANLNNRTAGTGSTSLSDCSVGMYIRAYFADLRLLVVKLRDEGGRMVKHAVNDVNISRNH